MLIRFRTLRITGQERPGGVAGIWAGDWHPGKHPPYDDRQHRLAEGSSHLWAAPSPPGPATSPHQPAAPCLDRIEKKLYNSKILINKNCWRRQILESYFNCNVPRKGVYTYTKNSNTSTVLTHTARYVGTNGSRGLAIFEQTVF
jgi:hypothetical protein